MRWPLRPSSSLLRITLRKGSQALRLSPPAAEPSTCPFSWEEWRQLAELDDTTLSASVAWASSVATAWPRGSAPRGALAGFDSPPVPSAPRGALAGFDFPARPATVSRWIPNSRAIRRYDQPCSNSRCTVSTIAILSRFAIVRLLPLRKRMSLRDEASSPQNGRFSSAPHWPVLGAP